MIRIYIIKEPSESGYALRLCYRREGEAPPENATLAATVNSLEEYNEVAAQIGKELEDGGMRVEYEER